MTDFEKMIKTLEESGKVESKDYIVATYPNSKVITLYKLNLNYFCGSCETLEFDFEYDLDGNLKEIR